MSAEHSEALAKRWKKKTPEQRSRHASMMAKARMKKLSPEERLKVAKRLVRARRAKRKAAVHLS